MNKPRETYSDIAQITALRVAKSAIEKDKALGRAEAAYHCQVLDHVADRIEDAAKRRREAEEAKGQDPRAVGASRSERRK